MSAMPHPHDDHGHDDEDTLDDALGRVRRAAEAEASEARLDRQAREEVIERTKTPAFQAFVDRVEKIRSGEIKPEPGIGPEGIVDALRRKLKRENEE